MAIASLFPTPISEYGHLTDADFGIEDCSSLSFQDCHLDDRISELAVHLDNMGSSSLRTRGVGLSGLTFDCDTSHEPCEHRIY